FYGRTLRRWPWISLATVAGGLLGLVASLSRAPVFQSSAVIEIGVDYNRTAPLREVTLEQAFDRVRALLLADETLAAAIVASGMEGRLEVPELRSRIRLAHRPNGWELFVDGEDPHEAAALAEAWANVAIGRMEEATTHGLRAAEFQWALYQASCHLAPDVGDPQEAVWVCQSDVSEGDPATIASALLAEASQSHGILPIFTYSVVQHASVPVRPTVWDRGGLILGGAIAGMVSGFTWAVLDPRFPFRRPATVAPGRPNVQRGRGRGSQQR
ncbi:MAG: hypothetical protein ACRDHY_15785, partial [Anaerolineales bacterium]